MESEPVDITLPDEIAIIEIPRLGDNSVEVLEEVADTYGINNELVITSKPLDHDIILPSGFRLVEGEVIGELHLHGANVNVSWLELEPIKRGRESLRSILFGLVFLAADCEEQKDYIRGINVFFGRSDVISPHYARKIGFDVLPSPPEIAEVIREQIAAMRKQTFGDAWSGKVRTIYDVWITREALMAAVPKLFDDAMLTYPSQNAENS